MLPCKRSLLNNVCVKQCAVKRPGIKLAKRSDRKLYDEMVSAISGENAAGLGFGGREKKRRKGKEQEEREKEKKERKERKSTTQTVRRKNLKKAGSITYVSAVSFFLFPRKIIRELARALWPKNALSTLHVSSVRASSSH